ncbi:hypothetical protein HZH66_007183 [Vespula vulgaris]|uniref:Uncharacterized protein n=1 Tax=Vespula vulgaris TaxID=7454 RepID=A0A834JXQ5_VESVU|nr:hypothetical protein HZH66_007183 [Vespula vulgaris]
MGLDGENEMGMGRASVARNSIGGGTMTTTTTTTTTKRTSCGPVSLLESPLPSFEAAPKSTIPSCWRPLQRHGPPHQACIPPIWVPTIGSEKCNGLNSRRGSYQGPWASPTRSPVQQPNF